MDAVALAGERDVESRGAELQQAGQQVGVVDVGAVGGVAVAAGHVWTPIRARSAAVKRVSARLFRSMKRCSRLAAGIELHRQAGLGE